MLATRRPKLYFPASMLHSPGSMPIATTQSRSDVITVAIGTEDAFTEYRRYGIPWDLKNSGIFFQNSRRFTIQAPDEWERAKKIIITS
jgi:hypothetical protein